MWRNSAGDQEWAGYHVGQRVAVTGPLASVEPCVVRVASHRGGTVDDLRRPFLFGWLFSWAVAVFWFLCADGMNMLLGYRARAQWREFAAENGLHLHRPWPAALGRIEGRIRDRDIRIARRWGLGDDGANPALTVMRIELDPRLDALRLRSRRGLAYWLPRFGRGDRGVDYLFDDSFALVRGDVPRWRALVGEGQVRSMLLGLAEVGVRVELGRRGLELGWKGLSVDVMDELLIYALDLADAIEQADGASWRLLADERGMQGALGRRYWLMTGAAGCTVEYQPVDGQTKVTVPLTQVPAALTVARRTTEAVGLETGNPILDRHIVIRGVDEALARSWTAEETTGTWMQAICGHGAEIRGGYVEVRTPGLIAEPGEVLDDLEQLRTLLGG